MHYKETSLDFLRTIKKGYICGYASTFGTYDADNDCIMRGAFKDSLKKWRRLEQWPKLLWQHKATEPIGLWTYMAEDSYGLYVEGQLALETRRGFEAYVLIKQGALAHLSIGFRPKESSLDPTTKARFITCIDLYEASLVTFASNSLARITAPDGTERRS